MLKIAYKHISPYINVSNLFAYVIIIRHISINNVSKISFLIVNISNGKYFKSLHDDPHFLNYFLHHHCPMLKHHEKFECILNGRNYLVACVFKKLIVTEYM